MSWLISKNSRFVGFIQSTQYWRLHKEALLASCAKVITKTVLPWRGKTPVLPTCPSSNFQPVFRRREVREGVREGEWESCDSQNTNYLLGDVLSLELEQFAYLGIRQMPWQELHFPFVFDHKRFFHLCDLRLQEEREGLAYEECNEELEGTLLMNSFFVTQRMCACACLMYEWNAKSRNFGS